MLCNQQMGSKLASFSPGSIIRLELDTFINSIWLLCRHIMFKDLATRQPDGRLSIGPTQPSSVPSTSIITPTISHLSPGMIIRLLEATVDSWCELFNETCNGISVQSPRDGMYFKLGWTVSI